MEGTQIPQENQNTTTNTVINPVGGSTAHATEMALTGTEALVAAVNALHKVLATPTSAENQES